MVVSCLHYCTDVPPILRLEHCKVHLQFEQLWSFGSRKYLKKLFSVCNWHNELHSLLPYGSTFSFGIGSSLIFRGRPCVYCVGGDNLWMHQNYLAFSLLLLTLKLNWQTDNPQTCPKWFPVIKDIKIRWSHMVCQSANIGKQSDTWDCVSVACLTYR